MFSPFSANWDLTESAVGTFLLVFLAWFHSRGPCPWGAGLWASIWLGPHRIPWVLRPSHVNVSFSGWFAMSRHHLLNKKFPLWRVVKSSCGRDTVIFQANSSWGWRAVFLAQHMFAQWLWESPPPGAEFRPHGDMHTYHGCSTPCPLPYISLVKKTSIYRTRQTNSLFRLLKTNKILKPQAPCVHVWFCKISSRESK